MTVQEEDFNDDQNGIDSMLVGEVEGAVIIVTKEWLVWYVSVDSMADRAITYHQKILACNDR